MKFKQILTTLSNPGYLPDIIALSEEGQIYIYTPERYTMQNGRKIVHDSESWIKLPDPPEEK